MNSYFRFIILAIILLAGILGVLVVVNHQAWAERSYSPLTSLTVNTLDDEMNSDGDCSLREAINSANTNSPTDACPAGNSGSTDTIVFSVSGTIVLSSYLDIATAGGPVAIDGGGNIILSGGNSARVFTVNSGANLTVEKLTITNGNASYGGGIANAGSLTVVESILSDNTASTTGGGIYNQQSASTTIISSTLSGNSANLGGGIYNAFALNINNSTLSGNSALQDGGAIYNDGSSFLTNCTMTGNTSSNVGGGIYSSLTSGLTLSSCTISGNVAGSDGGGIYTDRWVNMRNTILAGNSSVNLGPDCKGSISSYGYNLVGELNGCSIGSLREGDLTSTDAKLGPLQDNGGATYTRDLLPGSHAINGGNPDGCTDPPGNPLLADQRGFPRYGRCDIGAYEWQPEIVGPNAIFIPNVLRSCPMKLYFDDFSNPASGWPVYEDENFQFAYLNSEYRLYLKQPQSAAGASPGFLVSDYVAIVDARNAGGVPDATYGIIFGISEDFSQFYSFEVRPYNSYSIQRFDAGVWKILALGSSESIHSGPASNQLKIKRNGSLIWAYANGELLNIIDDPTYTGLRAIGLIAQSFGSPNVDIRFDNDTVYPITCGSANALLSKESEMPFGNLLRLDLRKYWESNHSRSITP